jgi:hypothetical protein
LLARNKAASCRGRVLGVSFRACAGDDTGAAALVEGGSCGDSGGDIGRGCGGFAAVGTRAAATLAANAGAGDGLVDSIGGVATTREPFESDCNCHQK